MDAEEPRYVRPGDEFGDLSRDRVPKWKRPNGEFQAGVFRATFRKYWPDDDRSIRTRYIDLEKSMVSLGTGIIAEFPTEWVENCLQWATDKNIRAGYAAIGLKQLLSLINNMELRDDFIRKWLKEANAS